MLASSMETAVPNPQENVPDVPPPSLQVLSLFLPQRKLGNFPLGAGEVLPLKMVSAWEIDEGSGGRESNIVSAAAGQEEQGGRACMVDQKEETEESFLAKSPRQSRAYAALMQVDEDLGPSWAGSNCRDMIWSPVKKEEISRYLDKDCGLDGPKKEIAEISSPRCGVAASHGAGLHQRAWRNERNDSKHGSGSTPRNAVGAGVLSLRKSTALNFAWSLQEDGTAVAEARQAPGQGQAGGDAAVDGLEESSEHGRECTSPKLAEHWNGGGDRESGGLRGGTDETNMRTSPPKRVRSLPGREMNVEIKNSEDQAELSEPMSARQPNQVNPVAAAVSALSRGEAPWQQGKANENHRELGMGLAAEVQQQLSARSNPPKSRRPVQVDDKGGATTSNGARAGFNDRIGLLRGGGVLARGRPPVLISKVGGGRDDRATMHPASAPSGQQQSNHSLNQHHHQRERGHPLGLGVGAAAPGALQGVSGRRGDRGAAKREARGGGPGSDKIPLRRVSDNISWAGAGTGKPKAPLAMQTLGFDQAGDEAEGDGGSISLAGFGINTSGIKARTGGTGIGALHRQLGTGNGGWSKWGL